MSVQFSGGEPTISPYFLDAVQLRARSRLHLACRRPPTASSSPRVPSSAGRPPTPVCATPICSSTASATPPTQHRKVGNLFDVKLRAIENLYSNGVDIIPVITIINGINNEQVGRIVQFALDNPKKIPFLSFQPVSFTGRDEAVTDERRAAQRYTLSHLAHDVKNQTGLGEPARDWFPISFISHLLRLERPGARSAGRLGPVELRLPPELRRRHGRHGGQGNQGIGARSPRS